MKLLFALVFSFVLYVAAPVVLHHTGQIQFVDVSDAYWVLGLIFIMLAIKIILTGFSTAVDDFTYINHGFQLTIVSIGGFLTASGFHIFHEGLILNSAIEDPMFVDALVRFETPDEKSLALLHMGFALSIFGSCITALLSHLVSNNKDKIFNVSMSPVLGFISYLTGAFVFSTYISLMLSEGMS